MLAEILLDSINAETGDRLTTFVLPRFPKFLQAELRTHRSTSQSHYSSRAIPIQKVINQVLNDPFIPTWTRFEKGMGGSDTLAEVDKQYLTGYSLRLRSQAVQIVKMMQQFECAKQEANRYLEPWMHGPCIITATDAAWQSFFDLRTAEGVQPDMRAIALQMQEAYRSSAPIPRKIGEWHIPYCSGNLEIQEALKVSAARCARISYANFEGKVDIEKDIALCDRLIADKHWTPLEHQAIAMPPGRYRNFQGWRHYRQHVEENL